MHVARRRVSKSRRVLVVTPALNAERHIEEALYSVACQAPPEVQTIHHVQDGGSTDGTVAILKRWAAAIYNRDLPGISRSFKFSYESEADDGMYNAINRAFHLLSPSASDILTWVNSDDKLAPGGITTVIEVFDDVPQCAFLSGRVALMGEEGSITLVGMPKTYSQANLAAGLHDGRRLPFIMQEGTFFTGELWLRVGGADESFRLAGDWDLWRRFAATSDHYTVDSLTGFHRKRAGQLSEDMKRYYREVDRRLSDLPDIQVAQSGLGNLIRFDVELGRWTSNPFGASGVRPAKYISPRGNVTGCEVQYLSGFEQPEGPYIEHGLPAGIRWIDNNKAHFIILAETTNPHRIKMTLRAAEKWVSAFLTLNEQLVLSISLPDPEALINNVVEFSHWLKRGENACVLTATVPKRSIARLLVISIEVTPEPSTEHLSRGLNSTGLAPVRANGGILAVIFCNGREDLLESTVSSFMKASPYRAHIAIQGGTGAILSAVTLRYGEIIRQPFPDDRSSVGREEREKIARQWGYTFYVELCAGDIVSNAGIAWALSTLKQFNLAAVRTLKSNRSLATKVVQRSLPSPNDRPVLLNLGNNAAGVADLPVTIVTEIGRGRSPSRGRSQPPVWLFDTCSQAGHSTRLYNFAIALQLLGVSVLYIPARGGTADLSAAPPLGEAEAIFGGSNGALLLTKPGCAVLEPIDASWSMLRTISKDGVEVEQKIPNGYPSNRHTLPSSWVCREVLELTPNALVVMIETDVATPDILEALQLTRAAITPRRLEICLLGPGLNNPVSDFIPAISVREEDLRVLPLCFKACDAMIVNARDSSDLQIAAASYGLATIDVTGYVVSPGGKKYKCGSDLMSALVECSNTPGLTDAWGERALQEVEASWSIEAIAMTIQRSSWAFAGLPHLASFLHKSTVLTPPPLEIASRSCEAEYGAEGQLHSGGQLIPLLGATIQSTEVDSPNSLNSFVIVATCPAVLILDTSGITASTLRLKLRGHPQLGYRLSVAGGSSCLIYCGVHGEAEASLSLPAADRVYRILLMQEDDQFSDGAELRILAWDVLGTVTQDGRFANAKNLVKGVPVFGNRVKRLRRDGDWKPVSGFHRREEPRPDLGLHSPYCWTKERFVLAVQVDWSGWRVIQIAVSGFVFDQKVRLIIGAISHPWCEALDGVIGRTHLRRWLVRWPKGKVDLQFEVTGVAKEEPAGRELGIIFQELQLGRVLHTRV